MIAFSVAQRIKTLLIFGKNSIGLKNAPSKRMNARKSPEVNVPPAEPVINIDIPRFRDFRGLSATGFDDEGNYNLGISDQAVFPEININEIEVQQGVNIAIIIRNGDKEKSLELLTEFGMPFKKK